MRFIHPVCARHGLKRDLHFFLGVEAQLEIAIVLQGILPDAQPGKYPSFRHIVACIGDVGRESIGVAELIEIRAE
ncbi:MAG: hypothetical protein B7Z57_14000 [Acidiphilium sp. 37-60-79]|nr:MAG: hypothetical protein B7Z57_14000 [Acidiphilium sp. 37-60-79]